MGLPTLPTLLLPLLGCIITHLYIHAPAFCPPTVTPRLAVWPVYNTDESTGVPQASMDLPGTGAGVAMEPLSAVVVTPCDALSTALLAKQLHVSPLPVFI